MGYVIAIVLSIIIARYTLEKTGDFLLSCFVAGAIGAIVAIVEKML